MGTDAGPRGECHVTAERDRQREDRCVRLAAEIGAMWPQAKERVGLQGLQEEGRILP